MERNRFEYGHIIDQNTFEQNAEEIKREVCEMENRYQAVIGLRGMTKRFYAKYNFW